MNRATDFHVGDYDSSGVHAGDERQRHVGRKSPSAAARCQAVDQVTAPRYDGSRSMDYFGRPAGKFPLARAFT